MAPRGAAEAPASSSSGGVALVTGATGLVGRYVVMHLAQQEGWKVYAVSRKDKPQYEEKPGGLGDNITPVQVTDLLDADTVSSALSSLSDVTHIFHCAYLTSGDDPHKDAVDNLALLQHVVEAVESAQESGGGGGSGKLQHVYVQAGAKWYGQHLGKYKTPAKESDPRYMTPNFYYDMVDYVQARVADGAAWTWSALLPNPVIGYSPTSYMNLLNCIAAYAALCKQTSLPFRFPGSDAAYDALTECCDVRLLAEAIVFTSTNPAAANAIFNVSNGDVFRWNEVWPLIGKHLGLEVAPPQAVSLAKLMTTPDKQQAWQALLKQHKIESPAAAAYDKLVPWSFADFCFGAGWDYFQSVTKLRRAGFESMKLDTAEMWTGWLDELKQQKLFPL